MTEGEAIHSDRAVARLVRRFSLAFLATTSATLPLTFVAGFDLGLTDTTRAVAGGLFLAVLALGAFGPWEHVLALRYGRVLFDLHAVGLLTILAAVLLHEGPIPAASMGLLMIATMAAFHVTRAGLAGVVAIVVVTSAVDLLRTTSTEEVAIVGSIAIITLVLVLTVRLSATALRRSVVAETRLRAESERRAAHLEVVGAAARRLATTDPQTILSEVAATTADLGWDLCGIYVEESPGGRLRYAAHHNLYDDVVDQTFPRDVGAAGRVLRERQTVVIEHYADEPDANHVYASRGLATVVGVPVFVNGELGGVVVVGQHAQRAVGPSDVHALELLAAQAGRAVELALRHQEQAATIDELRALDGMKNDFLATVSHELRSPLTVILGLAKVLDLRLDQLDPEMVARMVRRLRRNATSLDEIISTLLDVGRLESGRLEVVRRHFDVTELASDVVERVGPLLEHHEVVRDWDLPCWVDGDQILLGRVVENLLTNVARHTPAGTRVSVTARTVDDRVQVRVEDDGPGIAPEDLARIGERFFRGGATDTRPPGGMGLGLSLCCQVLALHDTRLDVVSARDRGTTFSFALPAVAPPGTEPLGHGPEVVAFRP